MMFQVLIKVIMLIAILVMNPLPSFKEAPDSSFHHQSMLIDVFLTNRTPFLDISVVLALATNAPLLALLV